MAVHKVDVKSFLQVEGEDYKGTAFVQEICFIYFFVYDKYFAYP